MATLSPTRMMSTPASSATRAPGASYAVTITSGVPLPLLARTTGAVIALVGMLPPSPSSALLAAGGCAGGPACGGDVGAGDVGFGAAPAVVGGVDAGVDVLVLAVDGVLAPTGGACGDWSTNATRWPRILPGKLSGLGKSPPEKRG